MKCPKCGYTSFDYNETCPKCKKGLAEVREKMNLPSFKPVFSSIPDSGDPVSGEPESTWMEQKTNFDSEKTSELRLSGTGGPDLQFESAPGEGADESGIDFSPDNDQDELSLDLDDFGTDDTTLVEPRTDQANTAVPDEDLDLNFEDTLDELSLDFDDETDENRTEENADNIFQTDQETIVEDALESDLDLAFDDPSDELSLDTDDFDLVDTTCIEPQIEHTSPEASAEDVPDFTFDEDEEASDLLSLSEDEDDTPVGTDAAEPLQANPERLVEDAPEFGLNTDVDEALEELSLQPDGFDMDETTPIDPREERISLEDEDTEEELEFIPDASAQELPGDTDDAVPETAVIEKKAEQTEGTIPIELEDLKMEESQVVEEKEWPGAEGHPVPDLAGSIPAADEPMGVADTVPLQQQKTTEENTAPLEVLDVDLDLDKLDNN